jgi:ureidoacrylate peracid hydrolase
MTATTVVTVAAKPESLAIDLASTAVLVIDMQNDFGSVGGMFERAGIDISGIRATIGPTSRVLAAARSQGVPIIYVAEAVSPDHSDIGPPHSPHGRMAQRMGIGQAAAAPDGRPSRIHIDATWHTEIIPELKPLTDEPLIMKRRCSGFHGTALDQTLEAIRARYLIVTGCTTSNCIECTIRDAAMRDLACLLPADCTAQPATSGIPSTHESSLQAIARSFGWVTTSKDVIDALALLR